MKKEERMQRDDGKKTRELLLECAGKLVAQQGYAATTSKQICQAAGTNLAAINYHFGSREGLYRELLKEVHDTLLNRDALQKIAERPGTPKERLEAFLEFFVRSQGWEGKSWQALVWAREVMSPTPMLEEVIAGTALPKSLVLIKLFSDYTGMAPTNPRVFSCLVSFMAPFLVLFLARSQKQIDFASVIPFHVENETLIQSLKQFAFAGLDSFCEKK